MKKIPRFARSVIPASGETRPRRDGPRTTPAKISPSRAGNLSRWASSPEALAARRRRRRLSKMSMGPQTTGETGHKENHLGIGPDSFSWEPRLQGGGGPRARQRGGQVAVDPRILVTLADAL